MSYALLNIEAIKKQALGKPLEALENKDRANTITLEDIRALKVRYNKLIDKCNRAEEYLNNVDWFEGTNSFPNGASLLKMIKQAQIDTIEYTVKRCAKEAKLSIRLDNKEFDEEDENSEEFLYDNDEKFFYIEQGVSYDNNAEFSVNEQSILNVANKIKEEL